MCGYFLLLPTRDEAGVSLGTHNLPKLFVASLLLTLLATPLASAFLSRYAAKELGLQALYRSLSLLVLGAQVGGGRWCVCACGVGGRGNAVAQWKLSRSWLPGRPLEQGAQQFAPAPVLNALCPIHPPCTHQLSTPLPRSQCSSVSTC